MDKNTLSQYGWVIICIIVIAILLGLATPFGNFVKDSVYNTTTSFGQKISDSLNFDGSGESVDSGESSEPEGNEAIQTWDISETKNVDNVQMTFYKNGTIHITGEGRMEEDICTYYLSEEGIMNDLEVLCEEYCGYNVEAEYTGSDDMHVYKAVTWGEDTINCYIRDAKAGEDNGKEILWEALDDTEEGCYVADFTNKSLFSFIPTSIVIEEGVTNISNCAFVGAHIQSLDSLPSTIKTIGEEAFLRCPYLSVVNISDGVEEICYCAFEGSSMQELTIPSTVKLIDDYAFGNCTQLESATIGAKEMARYTFNGCTNLKKVVIKDGMTRFYDENFDGCVNLTEVTIPASVAFIFISSSCSRVFENCPALTTIKGVVGSYAEELADEIVVSFVAI